MKCKNDCSVSTWILLERLIEPSFDDSSVDYSVSCNSITPFPLVELTHSPNLKPITDAITETELLIIQRKLHVLHSVLGICDTFCISCREIDESFIAIFVWFPAASGKCTWTLSWMLLTLLTVAGELQWIWEITFEWTCTRFFALKKNLRHKRAIMMQMKLNVITFTRRT